MKWLYSLRETILADPPAGGAPPAAPAVVAPPGVVAPDWVTGLADETLRADKTLAQYKTPEDAYRGLIDTKKAYGSKIEGLVKLPPADAKIDAPEVVAYRTAAGIPLTVEGYKEVRPPSTAVQTVSPDGLAAFIENVALPRGIKADDVQAFANFLGEWNDKQALAFRQGLVARQADLHKKWGANWNREIGLGKRALDQVEAEAGMSKEWRVLLESTGLNEHPDFILMAAYMGRNLFEQGIIPGHVEGALTREEYQEKMNAIRRDPKHAFNNPGHKDHKAAQDEMEGLLRAVAPGER